MAASLFWWVAPPGTSIMDTTIVPMRADADLTATRRRSSPTNTTVPVVPHIGPEMTRTSVPSRMNWLPMKHLGGHEHAAERVTPRLPVLSEPVQDLDLIRFEVHGALRALHVPLATLERMWYGPLACPVVRTHPPSHRRVRGSPDAQEDTE